MLREIEAALTQVTPAVTEWGLVQDRVMETGDRMGSLETMIRMTGKLDMDNDMDSVNSLELTKTIPSKEVCIYWVDLADYFMFQVIMKSRLINKRVTLNVGGVR